MKVKTKFETGDNVWFHDQGKIYKARIVHIDISLNGGEFIKYRLLRKDKEYDARRWFFGQSCYRDCCDKTPRDLFLEEELGETREDLIKILKRKENDRHEKEIEKILSITD